MENQEQPIIQEKPDPAPVQRGHSLLPGLLIGLFLLALFVAGGLGYWDGTRQRQALDQQQVDAYLVDQYNRALEDMRSGKYDFAQQRLDEIIKRNPNYPGAQDAQKKLTLLMNATATPVPTTTMIPSPTPNMALGEQLFQKAKQQYKDKDFSGMVQTSLTIRRDVSSFNPLRVDGLLFLGYREEGLAEIKALNIESGLYHLWLASQFSTLDSGAIKQKDWAENVIDYYQAAYRFRKTDLEKSVINFSEIYYLAPGFRPALGKDYTTTLDAFLKQFGDDNCYKRNKLTEIINNNNLKDTIIIGKRDEVANNCVPPAAPTSAAPPAAEPTATP
jgi:hypothetical protein